ncbi:NADH-dependent phenylglyoxylate dehydrogenase subunit epsilon [Sulfuritalea hydrogenivorans]|jgi:phenylglyoxylate dehydrogenase epsilon subunit|uniref:Phenylglyoxylate:acceptor oxidoreductase n=1 Tax=Sulfuritalea hydrogenivorans sk43H TaxID=1223802 RepID=W0SEF7_9PROT|nr:FAD-dependent oxidoreductase [Sulfuritalea hydrogenivorans]MDK9715544.1 FAD-dependent oxidoreductase [Sulfuritalea sp.]BAO29421.1 phenylglyoxylate:acceptor oxidoreductase [Sulfuritalea hydrogenivorans sk43H]
MEQTKYLVVGSSHAALEAVTAIRMHDPEGSLTLLTRDPHLPYSPTVLPYVVSGRSAPDGIFLRDEKFFADNHVALKRGTALKFLHAERNAAELADGSEIAYEKILLATGASPAIPPIPGIDQVSYHVLRTLDDATKLGAAIKRSKQAVVLGAGLVGMHAAENLVKVGAGVTVVEMAKQLTDGYFDPVAAQLIEKAFTDNGARILTGSRVVKLAPSAIGVTLTLENGTTLEADLLLVATGVRPNMDYLAGSRVEQDKGILVSDSMQTSVANVWSAGDCAQARGFFTDAKVMNAILPDATEQGRIAGMAMAGDPGLKAYPGGVPLNTYHFFGRHAISVGSSKVPEGAEVVTRFDEASGRYLKVIFNEGRLLGIYGVNEFFDGGVMCQLILRRVDLSPVKERFVANPLLVGRELMSKLWR